MARTRGRRPPSDRPRRARARRAGLGRAVAYSAALVTAGAIVWLGALYLSYSRLIDARLQGEAERTLPRVFARPVELRQGQALDRDELIARLNDLGYAQRPEADAPGEFAVERDAVVVRSRTAHAERDAVRVVVARTIQRLEVGGVRRETVQLDPPLLTALAGSAGRQKRRSVPLATIPAFMRDAVVSIEDQGFYAHPGINPFRMLAAAITNVRGGAPNLVGYSTITQQLARMFFLADQFNAELLTGTRSYRRKLQEAMMSLVLERHASKDQILELYLNDVYLGQRGSFAVHGVAEAARLFFGKDVANLSLGEAALIAGVIQSPATRSPFARPERAVERRNVVLQAMADEGYISAEAADRASREPLRVVARAVDNEAPYFVDMVSEQVAAAFPGAARATGQVDVFTTLDLNLQRTALEAVRRGLAGVDRLLARRQRPQPAQAALVAVDPATGEILAMVGGRSYNQSQYNRAVAARRQPGSIFKPFVYLAAFEHAADEGRTDFTPAALTADEPGAIVFGDEVWEPQNYEEYDGSITWRQALSLSRNLGTIHVGEAVGFDRVAALWRRVGVGTPPKAVPAITLGVFELSPLEVAQAYTLFVNGGRVRPLTALRSIDAAGSELRPARPEPRRVARPETAFLVTNMMRSVIDDGTAASIRAAGFAADAAGKTGTTNDLRDAWFAGFTPGLLTVVWVGFDDNTPLSLTGAQAAVPIWTEFMRAALAGRPSASFEVPEGVVFADIDRDTGQRALPTCPRTMTEAFLAGTEPADVCPLHRW